MKRPHESVDCRCAGCAEFDAGPKWETWNVTEADNGNMVLRIHPWDGPPMTFGQMVADIESMLARGASIDKAAAEHLDWLAALYGVSR